MNKIDNSQTCCNDDKLHHSNALVIEYTNGDHIWYHNGKLHRTDGPAIERANGDHIWYHNGKLHRTDGPAIERANGTCEFYIDDIEYQCINEWAKAAGIYNTEQFVQLKLSLDVGT